MNPPQGNCISANSLVDLVRIGEGAFGIVYKATWVTQDDDGYDEHADVAVKIMKHSTKEKVFKERDRMAILDHDNVVRLLGFVQKPGTVPWLVMEYMPHGSLLSYILENRDYMNGLRANTMMRIGWGIARGMEYLHYKGIIHGDLAARNCLIGRHDTVKIGDLGFYDAANANDYLNYNKDTVPRPIRWMPPENLPYELNGNGRMITATPRHSVGGDIWAFGVVLFELWSKGEEPFNGYTNYQVCKMVLNRSKPTHTYKVHMRQHVRNLMHTDVGSTIRIIDRIFLLLWIIFKTKRDLGRTTRYQRLVLNIMAIPTIMMMTPIRIISYYQQHLCQIKSIRLRPYEIAFTQIQITK